MPERRPVKTLRAFSISSICRDFELISYGCCRGLSFSSNLLETGDYLLVEGPFSELPSTILEDLMEEIVMQRGGPGNHALHLLIHPQLERFKVTMKMSKHISTTLLAEKCKRLKILDFKFSRSIAPTFYINFFTHFPHLVKLNLEGTIIDDAAFDSLGGLCHNLREINVSDTTISDLGLKHLTLGDSDQPRCRMLVSINVMETRVTAKGVASLLHFHPNLLKLEFENFSPVFDSLAEMIDLNCYRPVYDLRNLTFINGRVVTDGFLLGLSSCPLIENLVIRFTDLRHDLLYHVMELRNLKQLHLGNSSYTEYSLTWDEGVLPVLSSRGPQLSSLNLEKFINIDLAVIGELCPNIAKLRLSSIKEYTPVFNINKVQCLLKIDQIKLSARTRWRIYNQ